MAVEIAGREFSGGWTVKIRTSGGQSATPEAVYSAMRTVLRLPDTDQVNRELAAQISLDSDEEDIWLVPLGVDQLADLILKGDVHHWVASVDLDVWVDTDGQFEE